VLLVSLIISTALTAFAERLGGGPGTLSYVLDVALSFVIYAGIFAGIFKWLPDVKIAWRDVTRGAILTAVLFMIGQQAIGFYLGQSSMASSYGAAGSVMILLLWVYYSCQILLFGAEFTRLWDARHGVRPKPEAFAEKDPDAVNPKSALG